MEDRATRWAFDVFGDADLEARKVELEHATSEWDARHEAQRVVREGCVHRREVSAARPNEPGARRDERLRGLGHHAPDGLRRETAEADTRCAEPDPEAEVARERELVRDADPNGAHVDQLENGDQKREPR